MGLADEGSLNTLEIDPHAPSGTRRVRNPNGFSTGNVCLHVHDAMHGLLLAGRMVFLENRW